MTRRVMLTCLLALALPAAGKKPDFEPPKVSVGGHVAKPGDYEFKETTIFAMVYVAGGPTEFGSMRRVKVTRKAGTFTVDLTTEEGKTRKAEPGDSIEVPKMNLFGR